jgi:hypothetical protein
MGLHDLKRFIDSVPWMNEGPLFVPPQGEPGRPVVMGYVWSQVGWSELGEEEGQIGEVIDAIRQLPKSFWVMTVTAITTGMAKVGVEEAQAGFLEAFTPTPTGRRFRALIESAPPDEKNRTIFSPKYLAGLAKLALAHAPDDEPGVTWEPGVGAAEHFLRTYLKLCDVVEAAAHWDDDADPVRNILRFWVQEGDYGEGGGFGEPVARLDLLLRRIPEELGVSPSPSNHFEAVAGMPLGRFMAMAVAVLAYTGAMDMEDPLSIGRHAQFNPEDLVRLTRASEEEVRWIFDKLSLTEGDFTSFREADPTAATYYTDYSALRLRPLWRLERPEGVRYVPVVVPFLMWRVTDGLYWDVVDAVRAHAGEKAARQFMSDFGRYLEEYVGRLFERALPSSPLLGRRFHTQVRTSDNEPELDLLIPYGNAFVVGEEKSARFHYLNSVVQGDLDYIEGKDLEKVLYGPAAQLSAAVDHLRSGRVEVDGRAYDGEAVYPLLVTYGALPTMWPVWPRLLEELERRGLFEGDNVRRLSALQLGEVEILAALAMKGHAVRDVLDRYTTGDYADASFRNFARATYGDGADVNDLLKPEYEASLAMFKGLFRKEDQEAPQEAAPEAPEA